MPRIGIILGSTRPGRKGDVIAKVWPADRTGLSPVAYRAKLDGMVVGRHFPGLIKAGDCLSVVAVVA